MLIEMDKQGSWSLKGVSWKDLYAGKTITQEVSEALYGALCKLKDYEQTGLSPTEVEDLLYVLETDTI